MLKVYLDRVYLDDCTVGVLHFGNYKCCTMENPWLDNAREISCIPAGTYICKNNHKSPNHGMSISVTGVPNRTHILVHVGNWTSNTLGCILVGQSIKDLNTRPMVTSSGNTLKELMGKLPDEFLLVVT